MTKMQVKVNIHESLIKKIKVGQKAEIRIESFPSIVFVGTVKSVSQLADSTRPWMTGGVKQYPTVVTLDDLKGHELKPGMTAEAKVLVGELDNVLVVPVQAIAEHKGEFYAFVEQAGQHRAPKGEDRREQRDPRPDPRGARRRAITSPSTPGCAPPPNSSSTRRSKASDDQGPTGPAARGTASTSVRDTLEHKRPGAINPRRSSGNSSPCTASPPRSSWPSATSRCTSCASS